MQVTENIKMKARNLAYSPVITVFLFKYLYLDQEYTIYLTRSPKSQGKEIGTYVINFNFSKFSLDSHKSDNKTHRT